ncbi:MAG: hypothetical protein H6Q61_1309 [Firmicutes bacterium]|nr:hypothetical protein [Bacillota bacterium]
MKRKHTGTDGPVLATNAVVLVLAIAVCTLVLILRPVESEGGSLPDTGAFYQEYQDDINILAGELFDQLDAGEDLINNPEACWEFASRSLKNNILEVVMVNENTIFLRCGSLYHLSNGIVKTRYHESLEKQYAYAGLDVGISYYYIAENTYGYFSSSVLE